MGYPIFATGEVLTAADMNAVGLWKITPTSATNGTITSDGDVTVTAGSSSVTLNGVFNTNYENYLILVNGVDCSLDDTVFKMTLGSTATNYYANFKYYKIGTGNGDLPQNNDTNWYVGITDTNNASNFYINIFSPFLSLRTTFNGGGWGYLSTFTTGGMLANTTSYTGFTFTLQGGTMSGGAIRVYGYKG